MVESQDSLIGQLLIAIAVLTLFIMLRRQADSWDADDVGIAATVALLSRPISAAILVGLLSGSLFHARPVTGYRMALVPVAVVASIRVLMVVLPTSSRRGLLWLSALFVFDSSGDCCPARRSSSASCHGEAIVATTVYFGLYKVVESSGDLRQKASRRSLMAATALTGIGAICLIIGFVGLGRLLTSATIAVTFYAFTFLAGARVCSALVVVLMQTRPLRKLNMISRHGHIVRRMLNRVINIVVAIAFIDRALAQFSIRDPLLDRFHAVFFTPLELGNLSISMGDMLIFGFAIWASFQISKVLRFVFREDVFPRMKLPRGVPYAASNAMHYAVLIVGFFIAIMAAGVDMSRFAIIGGALGVGVGFGLQNVVNNFVSGLILLFERPVQIGDRVEVGARCSGSVERIGIRSSTLRTLDGAEVIVPNSNLISDQVTNWTLTDRKRRIVIPVGVAYGTDPQRVLDMLLELAAAHSEVIKEPEPQAIFLAHGESSLDFELRVWTSRYEDWVRIRSELTVAINRALTEADIEIPFPQRDLHIRSSDVDLGAPTASSGPADT